MIKIVYSITTSEMIAKLYKVCRLFSIPTMYYSTLQVV